MKDAIGWGVSSVKNPIKAGKESARSALSRLNGQTCHACIVFASVGYSAEMLLDAIRKETGDVPMVGCSGEGCIAPGITDERNHCVVVLLLGDPKIRMITAGRSDVRDSGFAGREIGADLKSRITDDARCVMVFPCGLNTVADEFLPGLEEQIGSGIPVIGGFAGDNHLRERTYQYHDWQIYEGGVSAALLCGDFDIITDVTHGCVPIGTEMEVTRVSGNRIFEIDHRPAEDVMVDYVGEDVKSNFGKVAIHFCIGQKTEPELARAYDPMIIRFIARHHPEDKSISIPVNMQSGDKIWMSRRDHEKIFHAAKKSENYLIKELGDRAPFFVLHFDCAGRGKIIFSEQDKQDLVCSMQSAVAPDITWIGFYTYGEFCPVGTRNLFHNYTAVIAMFVQRQ